MTWQEEFSKLKESLSGDAKKDIDTLFKALADARQAGFLDEAENDVHSLLDAIVSKAEVKDKAALRAYIRSKEENSFSDKMKAIYDLFYEKKIKEAFDLVVKTEAEIKAKIMKVKAESKIPTVVFRYFRNGFEKHLCNKIYPETAVINLDENYPELLETKAQLLLLMNKKDEAYQTANEVFEYNPISVPAAITLATISFQTRKTYAFFSNMDKAKDFAYSVYDFFNYNYLLANYYRTIDKDIRIFDDIRRFFNNQKTPYEVIKTLPNGLKDELFKKGFLLNLSDIIIDSFLDLIQSTSPDKDNINKESSYYKKLNEFYSAQDINSMLISRSLTGIAVQNRN